MMSIKHLFPHSPEPGQYSKMGIEKKIKKEDGIVKKTLDSFITGLQVEQLITTVNVYGVAELIRNPALRPTKKSPIQEKIAYSCGVLIGMGIDTYLIYSIIQHQNSSNGVPDKSDYISPGAILGYLKCAINVIIPLIALGPLEQ